MGCKQRELPPEYYKLLLQGEREHGHTVQLLTKVKRRTQKRVYKRAISHTRTVSTDLPHYVPASTQRLESLHAYGQD